MPGCSHPLVSRRRVAKKRRLRSRIIGLIAVALAGMTILYGESWLLQSGPSTAESAAGDRIAHALDTSLRAN